jgi:D-alanyl-D-alanine dipeptidase
LVSIADLEPGIDLEMRYHGSHNFLGRPVRGYLAPKCLLTPPAAEAVIAVHRELQKRGMRLRIYDCYRPQRAVDDFVEWGADLKDQKAKQEFYPRVEKSEVFKLGYIATRSGHSRGSTIDLTIDGLDMGTPFDLFDELSHTDQPRISSKAKANRMLLKGLMQKHGFRNLPEEWWHYTLVNEPFPNDYFDQPIER